MAVPLLIKSINNLIPWRRKNWQIRVIWFWLCVAVQLWISIRHFKVNIAHEINSMLLLSWVKWIWGERTPLWLQKRQQNPQVQMCVIFVTLFKNPSCQFQWKEHFNLKGLELTKFTLQIFLKYILVLNWVHKLKNLPVNEKQLLFAGTLHQSSKTRSRQAIKIKTFWNSFEINPILAWAAVTNATFCHWSCQCSAMLLWTLLSLRPIRCCCCWNN